jgi:hypothetical protein
MGEGLFVNKKILVMGLGRSGGVDVVNSPCARAGLLLRIGKAEALAESIEELKGFDVEVSSRFAQPADFNGRYRGC